MPVKMMVTYDDNTTELITLPVEIWQRGNSWNYMLNSTKKLSKVELDPEKIITDVNFENDIWEPTQK